MQSTISWSILVLGILYTFVRSVDGSGAQDPYATLGVSRVASAQEIKRNWKRLVMEWHPDKNESPHASDRFMQINKAYEVC